MPKLIPRCPATNKLGQQCGLPVNHAGQHQNGWQIRPWDYDWGYTAKPKESNNE